ncbi:AEC family transporter [Celeribacter litoreus]|uniref:AEC family transporter n=1 Tax=Celeribacter litoreus TaxID=2876714 RepID=UPI001CD03391|nr:AEC family transporter [Celeribacter litoreus]MCA0041911.1 AEC family transporter [Celeribacter litoreus]
MNLILTVLEIVTPVFLLALVGFTWVKTGHEYRLEFVTKLTMTLSVPALIFTALVKADIDPAALTALSLASVVAYGAVTIVAYLVIKVLKLDIRTYLAPLIFGNTGNLGLPLALFAFGQTGLSYAVVVFAVMALWSFTFGVYVTAGGGSPAKAFKEPLVWATALGALFLWQGWTLPSFAMNTLELLGQIAIPLMLITLGVAVARLRPHGLGRAAIIAIGKVVLCAGIAAIAGFAFDLAPEPFAVLVVQIATPVAVTSYMLAEKYGADSDTVAALVVSSTLLSVLYLPFLLAIVI